MVEPCSSDRFQCSNGQCVALALRCDGYADCRDHSDEKGCSQPPHCPVEQRCPHTHECLLKEWLCDGDKDCSDGSDERVRNRTSCSRATYYFVLYLSLMLLCVVIVCFLLFVLWYFVFVVFAFVFAFVVHFCLYFCFAWFLFA